MEDSLCIFFPLESSTSKLNLPRKAVFEIKDSVDRLHERQHDQNRRADSLESRVITDWLSLVNYHTD